MRASKVAIAAALRTDSNIDVFSTSIYAVERSVLPKLPSIEIIGVSSERVGNGPLARHTMRIEVTVGGQSEDDIDDRLDELVGAVRRRLDAAEQGIDPVVLADGQNAIIELGGSAWSVSAPGGGGVIRGASISLTCEVNE